MLNTSTIVIVSHSAPTKSAHLCSGLLRPPFGARHSGFPHHIPTRSAVKSVQICLNPSLNRNEHIQFIPFIEKFRISEVMLTNDTIFHRMGCGAWVTGSGPSSAVLRQELWELRPEEKKHREILAALAKVLEMEKIRIQCTLW